MAINISDSFHAAAVVNGTLPVPVYTAQRGFAGPIVRFAAVGVYDLTLENGLDVGAGVVQVQGSGTGTPIMALIDRPSDTVIRVSIFDAAGAPEDSGFTLTAHRFDL